MAENIINEDRIKLNKYNEHITSLEDLLKSVTIKGNYEQFRLAPCFLLFSFIDLLRGVAILDNNHMVVAGNIIVRSMFELLIDFLYCETDRKNLYLNIYKINCVYTHTDAGTICEYAEHINEGIDLNYQRKYNKDKFLLIKEINSMVEIFYNRFKDTYANNSLEEITF